MSYQVTQTNPYETAEWYECEFILVDDQAVMPERRLQKSFRKTAHLQQIIDLSKVADAAFWEMEYLRGLE